MPLEQAGIDLQAKNFADYIRRLDRINKAQQEVFNVTAQKTGKSYNEIEKAARGYEQEIKRVQAEEKKAAQAAQQLAATQKAAGAAQTQAFISAGQAVFNFAQQIGETVIESGKLAAQFQGQQIGLKNLAASFGQSGSEIQAAIQTASKGTISGLDAIQAANQALLFGVAKTPQEFETLTSSALTLGRTLGLTGTQSIEQFTTALGRQSLLILDNFGISAKQVNAEIERLAQADFGKARSELTEAQKQATFMKAALNIAGEAAATIGEEAGAAQASFDRLTASSENLKVTFGALVQPLGGGIADALSRAAKTAQQFFAFLGAGFTGVGTIASGVFGNIVSTITNAVTKTKSLFATGDFSILFEDVTADTKSFSDILDEAGQNAISRFKEIASTIEGVNFDDTGTKELAQDLTDVGDGAQEATADLSAYENALRQAQDLQLSFARAAEDTAIKLARANEDLARKQARSAEDITRKEAQSVSKLQEQQAKDRDKLLKDQTKQLDRFEANRRKEIARAEAEINKERKEAAEQRKRDQEKLQRELAQAQERFNLSQIQSERRFRLQESRLIAEGDILALQQLREDQELQRQEEKENFDLSQKEQVQSAEERQREQIQDLDSRVNELKSNLEEQRAELLASFDEQLRDQQEAQAEARAAQVQGFEEAAAERAIALQREEEDRQIALQREEEDRRLSQQRQLADLGRSFAEQEGVTAEGTAAIAAELEKIFGIDGTADNIISGFASKTKNEFTELFTNLEEIVKGADLSPRPSNIPIGTTRQGIGSSGSFGGRIGGLSEFQEGGIVPGPIGSPQIIQAHGGETVLPTHQRSFQMTAPVIPSQILDVNMSGGFNITGGGQADEQILQAATREMTDNFRIAIERLARRN